MNKKYTQPKYIFLFVIFLIALLLRLALVLYVAPFPERYIQADAIGYDQLAKNLVAGHGFSMDTEAPYDPNNFRTPLYPNTIAAVYVSFGYRPDIVLWLQAFMGASTVFLIYLLAKQISNQNAGLVAATLYAISPHSITYTALLWAETEYTLILTLSILYCIKLLMDVKIKWAILAGLFSGIAVLIHPRSLYLTSFFAIVLLGIMLLRKKSVRQTLVAIAIFLGFFYLVLAPWRIRNYMVFDVPNLTSAAGINMLDYGAALTESVHTGEDQWIIAQRYDLEIQKISPDPMNPAIFGQIAFKEGVKKILKDPFTYSKIHLIGMLRILMPGTSQINTILTGESSLDPSQVFSLFITLKNPLNVFPKDFLLSWIFIGFEIAYLCVVYFFSFYALIKQSRQYPWLWLIFSILFYLSFVAGPAGAPRFRVAMMPFFCTAAACGIVSIKYFSQKLDRSLHKQAADVYADQQVT